MLQKTFALIHKGNFNFFITSFRFRLTSESIRKTQDRCRLLWSHVINIQDISQQRHAGQNNPSADTIKFIFLIESTLKKTTKATSPNLYFQIHSSHAKIIFFFKLAKSKMVHNIQPVTAIWYWHSEVVYIASSVPLRPPPSAYVRPSRLYVTGHSDARFESDNG